MRSRELVDRLNAEGVRGIGGELAPVRGDSVVPGWWSELGDDCRENGLIASRAWEGVGAGFHEVASAVRQADVALAEVRGEGDESSLVVAYLFQSGSADDYPGRVGCVGFLPARDVESPMFTRMNAGVQEFYKGVHDGFVLDIRAPGDRVAPLAEIISWADWVGIDEPEYFAEDTSFGYKVPYFPDPRNLMMVLTSEAGMVFCDVTSPDSPWYEAGDVFECPTVDIAGAPVTPLLVLSRFMLRTLGYSPPLL